MTDLIISASLQVWESGAGRNCLPPTAASGEIPCLHNVIYSNMPTCVMYYAAASSYNRVWSEDVCTLQ